MVSVILARDLSSILMVTYVPTLLMNVINQATNFISSDSKVQSQDFQASGSHCIATHLFPSITIFHSFHIELYLVLKATSSPLIVWFDLHHQHHLHDGAGLRLPLCVQLSPEYLLNKTCWVVAPGELGLPISCDHDQHHAPGEYLIIMNIK